jgi:hypothetical protein
MAKKRKMIAKIKYNYRKEDAGRDATIELDVDLSRFEKQYGKAQFVLDDAVMTSMDPYMPHRTGTFINVTKAMSAAIAGSGTVVAAAPPMGRFLYEGNVMIDPETGSPWARPGAKKIVTDKSLNYDTAHHSKATDHWFETAKKNHGKSWVKAVKKEAGGG